MRALGSIQRRVLECLVEYKGWTMNCGWAWSTPRVTERYMGALVKRGLAKATPRPNSSYKDYRATKAGIAEAQKGARRP